ncbi:MAG TPA: hypothetical protein VFB79_15090 [Candidatus Angelobacter sp.]|nr:hypothetical protein [Candidatus Angelobacter sp.]
MWPLSIFLFWSMVPQSSQLPGPQTSPNTLPVAQLQTDDRRPPSLPPEYTCFSMRSYLFRRQDGQAPSLDKVTTCTPANTLAQRRVFSPPKLELVPLDLHNSER